MTVTDAQIIKSEFVAAQSIVDNLIVMAKCLEEEGHTVQPGMTNFEGVPPAPKENDFCDDLASAVKAKTTITINDMPLIIEIVTEHPKFHADPSNIMTTVKVSGFPKGLVNPEKR